jgi:hypothetical protein
VPRGGFDVGHVDYEHGGASLLHICKYNIRNLCGLYMVPLLNRIPVFEC